MNCNRGISTFLWICCYVTKYSCATVLFYDIWKTNKRRNFLQDVQVSRDETKQKLVLWETWPRPSLFSTKHPKTNMSRPGIEPVSPASLTRTLAKTYLISLCCYSKPLFSRGEKRGGGGLALSWQPTSCFCLSLGTKQQTYKDGEGDVSLFIKIESQLEGGGGGLVLRFWRGEANGNE